MSLEFASRLNNVETSAIRELFKLLGKPGIISFAGGFPDPAMFDVDGIREAVNAALTEEAGATLQYGATEGHNPLREQLAAFMASKGCQDVAPDNLIVTTGSQQALDLLGKTMISPGDKVIVEGPTFLATIQCFRLYGAQLISAPIDGNGVQVDKLEALIAEHKPKFVYLIPTFGNPSGAMLSLERRKKATAAQYLKAGRMPATLAHVRKVYAERALAMGNALRKELGDAIEFVQPQGGLFVWARLTGAGGKVKDGGELAKRAIEKGVAFVPGAPFYAANPDLSTLRLSFATAPVEKIEEGVARLGTAI